MLADNEEARSILLRPRAQRTPKPFMNRRTAMFGGAGAAIAATLTAVAVAPMLAMKTYRTQPGEQRRLVLADGSDVTLDTDSELKVWLTGKQRVMVLDRGQAFFKVAKDKARPFRVFAGGDEVRALGTAFGVRRQGEGAKVTLEEGRVGIYHAKASTPARPADKPAAVLEAGQQAVLAPQAAPVVAQADMRRAQAWRSGRLILEDSSLADAAAELNRYGAPQIVIADAPTGAVRVSGVFHLRERSAFVESVTAAFPVQVVRRTDDEIVLARRS
jgi:transmembrane sensor